MQRIRTSAEVWVPPITALVLLVSALFAVIALVSFSTGKADYSLLAFGAGGIACLMLTLWLYRNWKRPRAVPPEPVQERSDVQIAVDAVEAEADDFDRAFALSSADPFRGIVHDSWKELYKLLTSGGSAGEVRAARMNLAYYWERWQEKASIHVGQGRTLYSKKYGVDEAPSSPR